MARGAQQGETCGYCSGTFGAFRPRVLDWDEAYAQVFQESVKAAGRGDYSKPADRRAVLGRLHEAKLAAWNERCRLCEAEYFADADDPFAGPGAADPFDEVAADPYADDFYFENPARARPVGPPDAEIVYVGRLVAVTINGDLVDVEPVTLGLTAEGLVTADNRRALLTGEIHSEPEAGDAEILQEVQYTRKRPGGDLWYHPTPAALCVLVAAEAGGRPFAWLDSRASVSCGMGAGFICDR